MKKLLLWAALVPLMLFACTGDGGDKNEGGAVPVVGTVTISDVTSDSAQAVVAVDYAGVQDMTLYLCYSTKPEPDMEGVHLSGNGTFIMENLVPATQYYVCGCARIGDKYYYGPQADFTTLEKKKEPAYLEVSDLHAENMTGSAATVKYRLEVEGIKRTGVCWKEYGNPTIADAIREGEPGAGGEVVIDIDGLDALKSYKLRAYAETETGEILYSETSIGLYDSTYSPEFKVNEVVTTDVKASIAYLVSVRSGWKIVQKGLCISKSDTPTVEDYKSEDGEGTWWTVREFAELDPDTKYYIRIYAIVTPNVDENVRLLTYGEVYEAQTKPAGNK